jgi:hypothetical protein
MPSMRRASTARTTPPHRSGGSTRMIRPQGASSSGQNTMPEAPAVAKIEATEEVVTTQPVVPVAIPTLPGLPKLLYGFNKLRGAPHVVPSLSKRELAAIAAAQEQLDQEWSAAKRDYSRRKAIATENALSDLVPRQRVSFACTKGSAAVTTTEVYTSAMRGFTTKGVVTSADYNFAAGNSFKLHGRSRNDRSTITQRELLAMIMSSDENGSNMQFGEFISRLRPTPYSVRVVAADPIIEKDQDLTAEETAILLSALGDRCEYLFLDTLNKITDPSALKVFEHSDVIVFTANALVQESLAQLGSSMQTLRKQGFEDKVNHGVVVISNLPSGKKAEDYGKYLHLVDEDNEVVSRTGTQFGGMLLGVPHDPIIARDTVIKLEDLAWETYQAYLNVDIAIFRQDPRFWDDPSAGRFELKKLGKEPQREIIEGFAFYTPQPQ